MKPSKSELKKLTLSVRSRARVIYEGQVLSVSSVNAVGKFDVLGLHANFISLIDNNLIVKELNGSEKVIPIDMGVMRVNRNKVEVYIGLKSLLFS